MTKRDELGGESLTQGGYSNLKPLAALSHFKYDQGFANVSDADDFFANFTDAGEHALMMYLGDIDPGVQVQPRLTIPIRHSRHMPPAHVPNTNLLSSLTDTPTPST
jgi:hypothetical protein